jgi:hypothetical protein
MATDPEAQPWTITRAESFIDSGGIPHMSYEKAARANLLRIIGGTGSDASEMAQGIVNSIMLARADICAVLSELAKQGDEK